ncbi:protein-disulfide reductase DsbD domain-containing protein [Marinibacterium profundimaris]|uniref:protein-disulfide reductase DsbD domain-containing protein n=1 Tax=Marinibacterium profundimaris TaxID=1679460 RepID=UPI0038CC0AC3
MLASVLTAACALLTVQSGTAQAGPLDNVIRLEVIDGGATDRGTHLAGLRLTLAPGWKTYWRSPGDAGIPPQFDWRGSDNLRAVAMSWPAPHAFDQSGLRSIGYKGSVVLPLELTPAQAARPIRLRGLIDLGVCSDVCIPAQLEVDAALTPDAPRSSAIAAALAARPYSAAEAGVTSVTCTLAPSDDGLQITARIAMPPAGGTEVAVIEPGNPQIWASETETRRDGQTLTATGELIHAEGGAFALDRSRLRLTVLGERYAVDIRGCQPG